MAPGRAGAAAPSPATPEALQESKRHFDKGAALYEVGKYEAAHGEFREAYRLSHLPDLLFNLSRTSEMMGRPSAAVQYLELYLQENPNPADRASVEADIARLRKLEGPARSPVKPPGQPDKTDAIEKGTGAGAAGGTGAVVPPATGPQPQRLPLWPGLAMLGTGAGFLIIGIGLGVGAQNAATQAAVPMANGKFDKGLDQRGKDLNAAAITFDVLGALALGAGAGWIVWRHFRHPAAPPVKAALLPGPGGASLIGSF